MFRIPIRFKILVAVLLGITAVVGVITFTMANLFHTDKRAYIHDLVSVVALNTAEEAQAVLTGYRERLQVYARLLSDPSLSREQKTGLLNRLFEDFREFVAVSVYESGKEEVTVYDRETLEEGGISKRELQEYRRNNPLPLDRIAGGEVHVENSSLSGKLPVFTLAIPYSAGGKGKPAVVAGLLRLDNLLRIAGRSRMFETFLVDSRGNLLAHREPERVADRVLADWIPETVARSERQSAVTALEYDLQGTEMVGGFARLQVGGVLAGAQIPRRVAFLTARQLLRNLMVVSLVMLIVAALLAQVWSRRLTQPIERLSGAAKEVGMGRFDIQVESSAKDEFGDLAESFNRMASELTARERALLEAQAQLIQSEKLAAFGQLGAGIAHEVKNPLAGILGYTQLSLRKVGPDDPLRGNLQIIEKETKRCKSIIENLLRFARQDKVAFQEVAVNQVVEDTAALMDHQLGIHQVRLQQDLAPGLPPVLGNANQLQQVLMNLLINSQQAMEGQPGQVTIATGLSRSGRVEIRVSDTGPGIPVEIRHRLFDPFFTTKPAGKGTGLGLSVTYGIIKDHKGEIRVESKPGEGATFVIGLPAAGSPEALDFRTENAGQPA